MPRSELEKLVVDPKPELYSLSARLSSARRGLAHVAQKAEPRRAQHGRRGTGAGRSRDEHRKLSHPTRKKHRSLLIVAGLFGSVSARQPLVHDVK